VFQERRLLDFIDRASRTNIISTVRSEPFSTTVVVEAESAGPEGNKRTTSAPEKAAVVIEPSSRWVPLRLDDLWRYRELLYFLTWRDVKVRYKQTLLGVAWAILQPLLTMVIFTLLFGYLAGIKGEGVAYPAFAYGGLLIWTFFANSITNSGNSLVGSANLITKIYFPRMIIPTAAIAAGLIDFFLGFVILVGLMGYYKVHVTWAITMVPLLVVLTTLLALGVGMWLSALNVKYRDIRYAIPFLVQIWMFASPIIYPLSMLPRKWHWLLMLNPLTGIIENFRVALFATQSFNWKALAISTLITLLVLTYSAFSFRRMERQFADII
jgi:lipopolysaccharide transport system permease protein